MASNTYNLNTWSAKRIFGDASITTNTNALLQLTNNNSWLLNSGRSSVYGVKYVYDGTNNHDKIEFYGGYQVSSTNTPTIWTQLDTGDIYILGKVGVGQNPNSNYKLYVDGDTYISGKTYFDDLVGIDYDPATSGNTYKLYVNGSSCYAGDIIPSTTHTYSIGTSSLGWNNIYNQALSTRTIDAAPVADWSDSSVYIGYGAIEPTNAIRMYYSTDTSTRTEFFQINSDGSYALTRFGVNGQSTSYDLYVNGTANITDDTTIEGHLYLSVAAKHLYMKYGSTNYNIVHNHNNGNISVNAASTGLYLGYYNTTSIDFLNKKVTIDASGNTVIAGTLTMKAQNSTYEGGEIILNPATSSYATIHLDSYQNQFRIHNGSSVRLTVDLSTGLVSATGTISVTDLHASSAITLYNTSADSPDIIWYYANKAKEQARIWMGSGGTATFAPYYRCYNSSGSLLFSGRLVIGHEGYTGDLNNLTDHIGLYYATTGSNHPDNNNYLGVIAIWGRQIAWTGNGLYYRTKNSSGTWQKWQKVTATATST